MNPDIDARLAQFEGLIAETARQIVARGVELELDDVAQLLRVKAWRALIAHDTGRGLSQRRFVFGCVYNMRKDIEKRPRRHNASVDQLRAFDVYVREDAHGSASADRFDARYLCVDAEQVYGTVEDDDLILPSTLTAIERRVIALRLDGRLLIEIDADLGFSRAQRERIMRSIRTKLADWAPTPEPATITLPQSAAVL